jgi:hypothetical protein
MAGSAFIAGMAVTAGVAIELEDVSFIFNLFLS